MIVSLGRCGQSRGEGCNLASAHFFPYALIMVDAIVRTGKRGRPPTHATSVHVTLPPTLLAAIDAWIKHQPDKISRPEAIRQLAEMGLKGE
jgi:hypothetical protein